MQASGKVSYGQRLEELCIPFWNFYKAKKKYRLQDESVAVRSKAADMAVESYLTVELRTSGGTAIRIQGSMTAAHLHEIISAGHV